MLYVVDASAAYFVGYWHSRDYLCVSFFCSVFSIICYFISISNYRRPAWMARAFVAAFHIVFVKYICLHMYCGKQNIPILFLFLFLLLLLLLLLLHTQLSKRSIYTHNFGFLCLGSVRSRLVSKVSSEVKVGDCLRLGSQLLGSRVQQRPVDTILTHHRFRHHQSGKRGYRSYGLVGLRALTWRNKFGRSPNKHCPLYYSRQCSWA